MILFWCTRIFSRFRKNFVDFSPYSYQSHFLRKIDLIYFCKKCIRNYPNNLQCVLIISFFFLSNKVWVFVLLDNSFENLNENFLILYFKYSHLAWSSLIFSSSHTCKLSRFCRKTPSFYGNLQVSRFLSQNNILLLFQNNHANQVYLLYLLHTVKGDDFGQFFKVFIYFILIHTFIAMVLPEKKHFALRAQLSRSDVLLRTQDML